MAGVSTSRKSRKRVNKAFTGDTHEASSLADSSVRGHAEKSAGDVLSFSQSVTDLDTCQLVELSSHELAYCDICTNVTRKKVRSKYSCATCNVVCCPECYDFHHREQMARSLRVLRRNCPENLEILVSQHGELYAYMPSGISGCPGSPSSTKTNLAELNNLDTVLNTLKKQFNAKFEMKISADSTLDCIYFQDKLMEDFFHHYPEYLLLDVTCEIVDTELTLYLFISEDPNGHCEVVCAYLLKTEDTENLLWMCEVFKKHNPCWSKVKVLLIDSQIENSDVFKKFFKNSVVLLSVFHAVQTFKNDISRLEGEKAEKLNALKLFEKIVTVSSESQYSQLHEEFNQFSSTITSYFENRWHKKRGIWTLSMKFGGKTFLNPTNKFLWQIQRRMTSLLNTQKKLEKIMRTFFVTVTLFRMEHYQNISAVLQTAKVVSNVKMPHYKYAKFLTSYGGKLVIHQLNISSEVRNIRKVSSGKYKIGNPVNPLSVSITSCSCDFSSLLSLPCAHIFAVRKLLSLPLFWEELCSSRWIAKCYQGTFLTMHANFARKNVLPVNGYLNERFESYFAIASQILPLLTQPADEVTKERLNILHCILEAWKHNIKISVKTVQDPDAKDLHLDPNCSIDHLKSLYGVSADENFASSGFSSVSLCSESSEDEIMKCIRDDDKVAQD